MAGSIATHPARVLTILGLENLLKDLPVFDPYLDTADWPDPWTLSNYPVGARDRARIADAMKAAFLTRPAREWEEAFGTGKAPATAQRTTQEWLDDPHALASGLILPVDDPRHGKMHQMGNVAWLASDGAAITKTSARALEPDALHALLAEKPRTGTDATGGGLWLKDLKILDLTNVIAGPTIASTMARFGADVTHVQPVKPSVDPWNAVVFGLQANRGKQSILLDVRSETGRDALNRLIREADVITLNATDEQRDALGLSRDGLDAINPDAILVQLDAFGGPLRGPKSDHLGYDDLAQAATGIMVRFGGGMATPEEHAHAGTIDVLAGLTACVAVGAALIQKTKTGRADIARSSLAAAGNMIQAQFMYDFAGRCPFDEPAGRAAMGWHLFYRCYEASDGWFFLAAPTELETCMARDPELADLCDLPDDTQSEAMAERFKQKPVAHWVQHLTAGSSAAVPLASMLETRDQNLQGDGAEAIDIARATFRAVRHADHPMGRWCDLAAPNAIRPTNAHIRTPGPAPKYGADTEAVLARLGYDASTIQEMLTRGAAAKQWSKRYLPQ